MKDEKKETFKIVLAKKEKPTEPKAYRIVLAEKLGISYEEADRCIAKDPQDIRGFIAVPIEETKKGKE